MLIVDDRRAIGIALRERLEELGFEVYFTDKVATARDLANEHWESLSVAVLDMRLEDTDAANITGADIGISMRESKKSFPPEFLIYSAFAKKDYYQLAIELGVAAYLPKEENKSTDIVRHIKVLALRHALNVSNPRNIHKIASIAGDSQSLSEAITKCCKEILEPEFDSCLRTPFVILFGHHSQTYNCAANLTLPKGAHPVYRALQTLICSGNDTSVPFVVDINSIRLPGNEPVEDFFKILDRAVFILLPISEDFNLSIGILHDKKNKLPEDEWALVKVLQKYLRDTIKEQINRLWFQWEHYRILTIQSNTAKFCGFVGQEIKNLIEEDNKDLLELADDLIDTGYILWNNVTKVEKVSQTISLEALVYSAWSWIEEGNKDKKQKLPSLYIKNFFQISANKEDLEVAFARLLNWLVLRAPLTPKELEPTVTIKCEKIDNQVNVFLEDNSRRLDTKLRAQIFSPLTQAIPIPFDNLIYQGEKVSGKYLPLFLAKTLVPSLTDCSDDEDLKDKSYGHRFMMQFPSAKSFT